MIINKIKKKIFQYKWRKRNLHNYTEAASCFDIEKVLVGKYTYGEIDVLNSGTNSRLIIGNFCSIAANVFFCLGGDHMIDVISSYPFKVKVLGAEHEAISKGDIEVEDDVWIGHGAQVMSGVKIGQGAVIAAGAVVTKDVPPYAIAAGVPAKVIKYRFDESTIEKMMEIDYGKLNEDMIKANIDALYEPVKSVNQVNWMPKKNG